MRILLVEDDFNIRDATAIYLRSAGFAVDETDSAEEAANLVETYPYQVLLLDVGLPEGSDAGFDLVKRIREEEVETPVLFLTARESVDDRIRGLNAGGDDYLVKPFELSELLARVKAMIRRQSGSQKPVFRWGALTADWTARKVTLDGDLVGLTAKELGILELLTSNPGRIYTREEIIERVWDESFYAETNIIDVYIKNLRKKLSNTAIETVRGLGYRFPAHEPKN